MRQQQTALSTNRDTLQLPSNRDKVRERIENQLYYSPNKTRPETTPSYPRPSRKKSGHSHGGKVLWVIIQVIYLTSQVIIIIRCKLSMIFLASAFRQVVHNRTRLFEKISPCRDAPMNPHASKHSLRSVPEEIGRAHV